MEKTVTYCGQEPGNKTLGMFRYQDRNPKEVGLGYRENVQVGSLNRTKWARLVRCWPVHSNGWLMPRPVLLKDRLLERKKALKEHRFPPWFWKARMFLSCWNLSGLSIRPGRESSRNRVELSDMRCGLPKAHKKNYVDRRPSITVSPDGVASDVHQNGLALVARAFFPPIASLEGASLLRAGDDGASDVLNRD